MATVGSGASGGFGVSPGTIAEDFLAEFGEVGIVGTQFIACVHMVVRAVVFAIGVEPRLHGFGPVLTDIACGIGAFPEFCLFGLAKGGAKFRIDRAWSGCECHLVN